MTAAQRRKAENMKVIKEMHLAGKSREEIAAAVGYKVSSVGSYLSNMGLIVTDNCENHIEQIGKWWEAGRTLKYISEKTGYSQTRISKVLRKYGYKQKKRFGVNEPELVNENTVFADEEQEETERVYACGKWYKVVPEREIFGR